MKAFKTTTFPKFQKKMGASFVYVGLAYLMKEIGNSDESSRIRLPILETLSYKKRKVPTLLDNDAPSQCMERPAIFN